MHFQKPVWRKPFERFAFEHAIVRKKIEDGAVKDEEAAIDPVFDQWFIFKFCHCAFVIEFE